MTDRSVKTGQQGAHCVVLKQPFERELAWRTERSSKSCARFRRRDRPARHLHERDSLLDFLRAPQASSSQRRDFNRDVITFLCRTRLRMVRLALQSFIHPLTFTSTVYTTIAPRSTRAL